MTVDELRKLLDAAPGNAVVCRELDEYSEKLAVTDAVLVRLYHVPGDQHMLYHDRPTDKRQGFDVFLLK